MRQLGSSKREIFSWLDRYKAHLLIFFNRLVDRLVDRSCALFFRLCRDSFPSSLGTVLLEAPEVGVRPPALNAAVGDAHVHDLKDFSCFPLLGLVIGVIQRFLVKLLGAELIPRIGFHKAVDLPGSGILLHVFLLLHDGTVLGQDINDTTLRTVSQAIRSNIKPPIYPSISEQTYGKRKVVYVKFDGTQKPYLAYNIPRIRIADEDSVMEQPLYEEMLRQRESISYSWESQRSKYKVSDIDKQVFDNYLKRAKKVGRISFEEEGPLSVLTKLDLTDGEWLLNAGAALFVSSGMNELQMAKFASDEKLTFTDIRRFTGSILDLADKAAQYVIDAMDWRVEFGSGLERQEIPEIPVDAIREAVINAFAHRQLESGQSVEIAVYRSFIEIYSPGKFPEGVEPEQFIREIRKPIRRNPLITRTLYYSKDMESFATGLKRIYDACETAECKVEFYGDDYGFTVRFYRHCGDGWNQALSASLEKRGTQSGTQDDSQAAASEKLIKLIRENKKATRKQMAEALSVSTRTIQRLLKELPNVHYVGSGYSGHWEIDDPEK